MTMSTQVWVALAVTALSVVAFVVTLVRAPRAASREISRTARVVLIIQLAVSLSLLAAAIVLIIWLLRDGAIAE